MEVQNKIGIHKQQQDFQQVLEYIFQLQIKTTKSNEQLINYDIW